MTSTLPVWLYIVVFLVLALVAGLIGCNRAAQVEQMRYKVFVGPVEYNGHNYFVFRALEGGDITVVHDPDCVCNSLIEE